MTCVRQRPNSSIMRSSCSLSDLHALSLSSTSAMRHEHMASTTSSVTNVYAGLRRTGQRGYICERRHEWRTEQLHDNAEANVKIKHSMNRAWSNNAHQQQRTHSPTRSDTSARGLIVVKEITHTRPHPFKLHVICLTTTGCQSHELQSLALEPGV